eukprot:12363213-Alexandrium_andersonii.AAC.1
MAEVRPVEADDSRDIPPAQAAAAPPTPQQQDMPEAQAVGEPPPYAAPMLRPDSRVVDMRARLRVLGQSTNGVERQLWRRLMA